MKSRFFRLALVVAGVLAAITVTLLIEDGLVSAIYAATLVSGIWMAVVTAIIWALSPKT